MSSEFRLKPLVSILACLVLTTGCTSFDLGRSIPWLTDSGDDPTVPNKIVAVWKDTVLHHQDKPSTRGFGGRLMFYSHDMQKPVKVDGSLVVYAFDEEGRGPTDTRPDKKYVFSAKEFSKHYSESKIGHSYSVWLPWDEVGGPQKDISLIAHFTPAKGPRVVANQVTSLLPGTKKQLDVSKVEESQMATFVPPSANGSVTQVSYDEPAVSGQVGSLEDSPAADKHRRRMDSFTVPTPPGYRHKSTPVHNSAPAQIERTPPTATAPVAYGALPAESVSVAPLQTAAIEDRASVDQRAALGRLAQASEPRFGEPSARFSLAKPRAQDAPIARPAIGRNSIPPLPLEWQYRRQ